MRPITTTIAALTAALTLVLPSAGISTALVPDGRGVDGLPTVEDILERYYEALGGREALERITTRVATGRVVDDRPYTGPVRITMSSICQKVSSPRGPTARPAGSSKTVWSQRPRSPAVRRWRSCSIPRDRSASANTSGR